jgi:bleomycin hydrolase
MKKLNIAKVLMVLVSLTFAGTLFAQADEKKEEKTGYEFTDTKIIPHTSVKDQNRSGTCWSYAGTSFVEAEIMKNDGPELDLSEMYSVRNAYEKRAESYVRLHGAFNFGPGGEPHQVMETIAERGMTTNEAYSGNTIGEDLPVHGEMDNLLEAYIKAVAENKNKKLSPVWFKGFNGILDAYLGEIPEEFKYDGKTYTPVEFAEKFVDLDADDYVEITSYTHAPYYKPFLLKIPDNWDYEFYYNVPIDDLLPILDNALENGFSVAWAADVSDKGFNHKKGMALVPEKDWEDMKTSERDSVFIVPAKQRTITAETRQEAYNDYTTTDDHSMHIIGLAEDQDGNRWYKVKNSWATDSNDSGGYFYASKNYMLYKTVAFYLNKKAVPKNISKKMDL